MNYILSETQKSKIEELTSAGSWGKTDVDDKVFSLISYKVSKKKITELTKFYFENVVGFDITGISPNYFEDFIHDWQGIYTNYPKKWRTPDVISGLGYFLMNKTFKLKKGVGGLIYHVEKKENHLDYYFFDESLELTIGFMSISKFDKGYFHPIYSGFPKGTYRVSLSMIDDKLIGMGYGKSMYLTVIDTVSCLMSDDLLYRGSLNLWIHSIPKSVKYAGYISSDKKLVRLPTNKKLKYSDIDVFFASNFVDLFN